MQRITSTPTMTKELTQLVNKAHNTYKEHFNGDAWFGRCIFLSFYCERGTCTFCFRSVAKHTTKHPKKARRSLASILTEALLIRAFNWRIEFLTGGYGILDDEELLRTIKLVSQALGQKLWINLGEIQTSLLEELQPYVEGIVSSIETTNKEIHEQVCPDKPITPYEDMITKAKTLGFKQSMTFIVGLGETQKDLPGLLTFINKHQFERITIYALRPVQGTPFTKGPTPQEVTWWIAQVRINCPTIEIIAGSAEYRLPEIELFLKAGANAITKLPATKLFNTTKAFTIDKMAQQAQRNWISQFTHNNPLKAADWNSLINELDLSNEEKTAVKKTLHSYLTMMNKQIDSCEQ